MKNILILNGSARKNAYTSALINSFIKGTEINGHKAVVFNLRDMNKLADSNLTLTEGIEVNSPAIKEIPLTLECKVIYSQEQEIDKIPAELKEQFYPQNIDSTAPMANRDYHTVYYGEIVQAYIL